MPMDRSRYGPNWEKVSRTIRRIANQHCEWCGIANGAPLPSGRNGKVVLTVAHLGTPRPTGDGWLEGNKSDKHDVRRENLAALCNRCHLAYDLLDHMQHARETRQRKKREEMMRSGQMQLF